MHWALGFDILGRYVDMYIASSDSRIFKFQPDADQASNFNILYDRLFTQSDQIAVFPTSNVGNSFHLPIKCSRALSRSPD